MTILVISLFTIYFVALISVIIYQFAIDIDYKVHKKMVKRDCTKYGIADYETFKQKFDEVNWGNS